VSASDDPRFTTGLLIDVRKVLAEHGYVGTNDHADVLVALLHLVRAFEGVKAPCQHDPYHPNCTLVHLPFSEGRTRCTVCNCRFTLPITTAQIEDKAVEVIRNPTDANARLIAAAPELLEVCELIIGSVRIPDDNVSQEVLRRLRLAVRKAKGDA